MSGGADSTALLVGLGHLAEEFGWTIVAAHLHHGLRGRDADQDLAHVRGLCGALRVPLLAARWNVKARMARLGISGQAGMRRVRRAFLRAAARRAGAVAIATAHHAEDQLETLLLRLLRGCRLDGLGAMSSRRGAWIRPLLAASRSDVEKDLRAARIPWREDLSNTDPRYARNRIRHDAVPALLRAMGANADERSTRALALRVGGTLREVRAARRLVERRARRALETAREAGGAASREGVGLVLDATVLARSPRLVRATALGLAWRSLQSGVGLTSRHLSALTGLASAGAGGKRACLPRGWIARRDKRFLRFVPGKPTGPASDCGNGR